MTKNNLRDATEMIRHMGVRLSVNHDETFSRVFFAGVTASHSALILSNSAFVQTRIKFPGTDIYIASKWRIGLL